MRKVFKSMLILLTFCLIFLGNYLSGFSYAQAMEPLGVSNKINKPAPKFSLYDLDTNWIESSAFKGKKVVLFFWTTWCPYCRKSLVKLQNQYPSIKAQDIVILGINIGESSLKVKSFLKENPASFKVLLDTDSKVAEDYQIGGIPAYVLIGIDGNIKSFGNDLPANYIEIFK